MRHVVGMFESTQDAERVIERLKALGIGADSVSVAVKDTNEHGDRNDTEDMSSEGATAGAVSGAAIGAIVGLAVAGSTFVLPGVGTFLVWGPLAAALSGAGLGAASGGILGTLIGAGVPEPEVHHYLTGLEAGRSIITASVPDCEADMVRFVFNEEGSQRTHVA